MAKSTKEPSIINTQIVLSMATLLMILTAMMLNVSSRQTSTDTQTQASQESDTSLLSRDDDIESLENDLLLLQQNNVESELQTLNSLQ